MPSAKKMRLDAAMVEMGLQATRSRAQALIMAGHVSVNGTTVRKNGLLVTPTDEIRIQDKDHGFVSRGGLKLEAALRAFAISPAQRVCLDVGASTGGFTDCLLQAGARRVYAVDVGYGQFAWKLRQDPRVVVIERTNIRHMPPNRLPEAMDLATIDVSFISLKIVVPVVLKFMAPDGQILALIKPQFEVGRGCVGKGGVVKDEGLHRAVVDDLKGFFGEINLRCKPVIESPIRGPKGNKEFLAALSLV